VNDKIVENNNEKQLKDSKTQRNVNVMNYSLDIGKRETLENSYEYGRKQKFDKQNTHTYNSQIKYIDHEKELDLSSMSNSMFQSERKTNGRRIDAMNAIDILEKAYERSSHIEIKEKTKPSSFWSFLNPFKCGPSN